MAIGFAMLMIGLAQLLVLSDKQLGSMFMLVGVIELVVVFVLDRVRGRRT